MYAMRSQPGRVYAGGLADAQTSCGDLHHAGCGRTGQHACLDCLRPLLMALRQVSFGI